MDRQHISFVLGERLKALREERGLSHVDLTKQLNEKYGISVSRDSVMAYEIADESRAKASKLPNLGMRVEYLYCLADFYGVSFDYLLGKTDIPSPSLDIRKMCEQTALSRGIIKSLCANQKYAKPGTDGRIASISGFNAIFNPAHKLLYICGRLSEYVSFVRAADNVIESAKQDLSTLSADNESERVQKNNKWFLEINSALEDVRYSRFEIIDYLTELITAFARNNNVDDRSCGPDILYPENAESEY